MKDLMQSNHKSLPSSNTSVPVFTINSGGSGSSIMNVIIKGFTGNAGV